jgi:hypothetical protein
MVRQARLKREGAEMDGFRMRGAEVARFEGFSDAVFAFALTLLVVSLEVPKTFDELLVTMRGFVAFGVCFAILVRLWDQHYTYCRRFGMDDGVVRALTATLLFIVLMYVYPLKFLFKLFFDWIMGVPSTVVVEGHLVEPIRSGQMPQLFLIYGLGFAAVYLAFALLYGHAIRRRGMLELSNLELFDTKWEMYGFLAQAAIGLLSAALAVTLPAHLAGFAGFTYFSIGIVMWIHGSMHGSRRRKIS